MIVFGLLALQAILATGLDVIQVGESNISNDYFDNIGIADDDQENGTEDHSMKSANEEFSFEKEISTLKPPMSKKGERLLRFLQVDDIDSGLYDDPANLPENSCTRPCVRGDTRTCYYKFYFESFVSMGGACGTCATNETACSSPQCVTADGKQRSILTINRRMPAPSIQVCEGDKIVVDVHNMMGGRSTTIHWHGLPMKDSKFMDGVPMVTQCPIEEGTTFRYSFKADPWGMFFYHSHDGLQKVDGLVGSFVVRLPKEEDPNKDEYDYDLPSHVIVVQDWNNMTADALFPGLTNGLEQQATNYLIQGKGQLLQEDGTAITTIPLAEFNVTQGNRYVFRIVAGTCFECQYIFTIESHDFVIIGADGRPTQPYRVDSLTMSPGERFTVVVNANKPVDAYWMTVRTTGFCADMKSHQVAVLRYDGAPKLPSTERPNHLESEANKVGLTINPLNSVCSEETRDQDGPCMHHLRSAYPPTYDGITNRQPDLRIYWVWFNYRFTTTTLYQPGIYYKFLQTANPALGMAVNGIVNSHPTSPLLSQPKDVSPDTMCSADIANFTTWSTTHRECTHVIKLPANSVIEIVSIDNVTHGAAGLSHSIHLHGYDMHMLEMGLMNQNVTKNQAIYELMEYLDSDERLEIPSYPVNKDTFPLTSGGYAVTRIFTDNPGYWFFHCHFAFHLDSGMSGTIQVGDSDTFPQPPRGFPRCGNFAADV